MMQARLTGLRHKVVRASTSNSEMLTFLPLGASPGTGMADQLRALGATAVRTTDEKFPHREDRSTVTVEFTAPDQVVFQAIELLRSFGMQECVVSHADLLFTEGASNLQKLVDEMIE
jgi:hypothetical protein